MLSDLCSKDPVKWIQGKKCNATVNLSSFFLILVKENEILLCIFKQTFCHYSSDFLQHLRKLFDVQSAHLIFTITFFWKNQSYSQLSFLADKKTQRYQMTSLNSIHLLLCGRSRSQIQAFLPLEHDSSTSSWYTLFHKAL